MIMIRLMVGNIEMIMIMNIMTRLMVGSHRLLLSSSNPLLHQLIKSSFIPGELSVFLMPNHSYEDLLSEIGSPGTWQGEDLNHLELESCHKSQLSLHDKREIVSERSLATKFEPEEKLIENPLNRLQTEFFSFNGSSVQKTKLPVKNEELPDNNIERVNLCKVLQESDNANVSSDPTQDFTDDVTLQDTTEVQQPEEKEDEVGFKVETDHEAVGEPRKRRRGKDINWKKIASFPSKDQFDASDIKIELSEMTRNQKYDGHDFRTEVFVCRYFKKQGWMSCKRSIRVGFPYTSYDILVWEPERNEHHHEMRPDYGTDVNYHWTPAQEEFLRQLPGGQREVRVGRQSLGSKKILQEVRKQIMANGAGQLPTEDQVARNKKDFCKL